MLWTIIGILLLIWFIGFMLDAIGYWIHILLAVAVVLFIYKLIAGRDLPIQ